MTLKEARTIARRAAAELREQAELLRQLSRPETGATQYEIGQTLRALLSIANLSDEFEGV